MDKQFEKLMRQGSERMGVSLTDVQLEQFYRYFVMLVETNKVMNLTAITEMEDVVAKHFLDSLALIKVGENLNREISLIDVGTGAGFPGIPLKIAFPDLQVTLLDSLNKRVKFLNEVIEKLDLKNIQAVHGRAEEFNKIDENRENYDIIVSRAVAKLNVLLEYMLPFVKLNGKCICMKSADIDEELKEAKNAIKILGGEIEKIDEIILKNTDIKRKIIVIKKVNKTPSKYPRKAGTPAKEPIK